MLEVRDDAIDRFLAELRTERDGCCQRIRHRLWVGDRSELDKPHSVGPRTESLPRRVKGQSGLTDTTDTCQRDQPRVTEERVDLPYLLGAADEHRPTMIDVAARSLDIGHRGAQVGVLPQHLAFERSKCHGWLESEFFAECSVRLLIDAQRLGLAPRAI